MNPQLHITANHYATLLSASGTDLKCMQELVVQQKHQNKCTIRHKIILLYYI